MAARFNLEWMSKEEYKDWLLPEDSDNTKATCKLRRKTFSLSNMGKPSLKSHAQGKKHQSIIQRSEKNPSVMGFGRRNKLQRLLHLKKVENHLH